ncbi:MAG TPA: ATP-binding cassette domain-containing protein [Pusillimonas sp.]|uniref:ABC transporter ATP-binding protein n=1 Tax=Pusillimonas sp. TaxID=3040095 RepID=UPI002C1F6478|nr:ATP-binding cassette domain-containing protein [Pusillimonas sp.]HUH87929.1 ATP-binding cassette domain-containing protein [Pusillimonas sp.]
MLEIKKLRRLHIGPIDLVVNRGECISVSGRSGAGKSLLLRMIADLDPHKGDCFLEGVACSSMPAPQWRRQVTYVPAESGWWADTVGRHFYQDIDLQALLPQIGIDKKVVDWPTTRLSTGERQRLALLRALGPANRVLLLDEPTSALDPHSVAMVETLLRARMDAGTAIVLVTHDVDQARRMGTRHVHLDDGNITEISREALSGNAGAFLEPSVSQEAS